MKIIPVSEINSLAIRGQCESEGIESVVSLGDNGKTGDEKITAYLIWPVRVLETNGEGDPEGFALGMIEIEIAELVAQKYAEICKCLKQLRRWRETCEKAEALGAQ